MIFLGCEEKNSEMLLTSYWYLGILINVADDGKHQ